MSALAHDSCNTPRPAATITSLIVTFMRAAVKRRTATRDLQKLQDHELRDLGINRHDIAAAVENGVRRLWIDEFRSRGN